MWREVEKICERLDFSRESIDFLKKSFVKIQENESTATLFCQAQKSLFSTGIEERERYVNRSEQIAQKTGLPMESVNMVLFVVGAVQLREDYKAKGLSDDLFFETMQDLRIKLEECKSVHGIFGTFVAIWFHRFYLCERFALGRLQFEKVEFPHDSYKNIIKKGDVVYNCHIPSGSPLSLNGVLNSLKRAYEFYKKELQNGILPVVCHSWLLYGPHSEIFSDCKNVESFRECFDVVENKPDETNSDFWRVFNVFYDSEKLKEMPENTRLQKKLKEYLLKGNHMGFGLGVLLFDGEKIL